MHQSKENLTDLFKKKHGNLEVGAIVRNALLLSSSVKQSGLRLIQTLSSFTKEVKTNIWAELVVFIALLSQRDNKLSRHSSHQPNRIRI